MFLYLQSKKVKQSNSTILERVLNLLVEERIEIVVVVMVCVDVEDADASKKYVINK